ncbi:PB1 domain containing protein [Musa troglodytarum]|uniref:PB1 domain containing protein n=1 Tax=Musa troglodytarum TaxID=320322 RepID=A0A9E7JLI4_9LILI|nr:PB1 domain containing protein [Musa troglodytarum]
MDTVAAAGAGTGGLRYADSVDSSPRSRGGDSLDEPPFSPSDAATGGRLRLMCSYGGRIVPRPSDKSLCYLGGETRIVVVDRHSSLADLSAKLSRNLHGGRAFSLKYQLPNEDLDSLISVATDEDLDNMVEEYDRILASSAAGTGGSTRSSRLRLFLFPSKPGTSPTSSIGSLLDDSKSETWFVDALNSAMNGMGINGLSSDSASVNCLLGLEDDASVYSVGGGAAIAAAVGGGDPSERPEQLVLSLLDSSGKLARHGQDVQSVPDSPMLDTTSSFGSASSAPSLSNLPPVLVRPDDRPPDLGITGLEGHFAQMNLSAAAAAAGGQRLDNEFKESSYSPQLQPPPPISLLASSASTLTISPTDNPSRAFSSDDEKSDHGSIQKPHPPPQSSKPNKVESPISDSGSRTTYSNATLDPKRELAAVSSIPSHHVAISATDAAGCQLPSTQLEQFQQQQLYPLIHHHHHQQQQHQYIPANPHYIHHPATGVVIPVPSYFPIAAHTIQQSPQVHPYDPHLPLYYYPVHQTPPINLADVNSISSGAKSPMAIGTDQIPAYAGTGYHVVQHHQIAHSPASMSNYGYQFAADHSQPQMYYSQTTPPPALAPADAKATRAS